MGPERRPVRVSGVSLCFAPSAGRPGDEQGREAVSLWPWRLDCWSLLILWNKRGTARGLCRKPPLGDAFIQQVFTGLAVYGQDCSMLGTALLPQEHCGPS